MTEISEKSNDINELGDAVPPNESQEKLKASLESSIASLEGYQDKLKELTPKAKGWFNDAENKMREVTNFISEQFTILRAAIDKKEEEIMQSLEMNSAKQEDTNKLIHNAQELMYELPAIIEGVKSLFSEWDNRKERINTAEEILSIKEKVKSGEDIVRKLKTFENCEAIANTEKFFRGVKRGLDEINSIGEIPLKKVLCTAPTGLTVNKAYSVYVILFWDKVEDLDEYIVSYREEEGEWNDGDKFIHVDKKKNYCVVYPLKPETRYEFHIMGKNGGMETRWSEAVSAMTEARLAIPTVDNVVRKLKENANNANECIRVLDMVVSSLKGRSKN